MNPRKNTHTHTHTHTHKVPALPRKSDEIHSLMILGKAIFDSNKHI